MPSPRDCVSSLSLPTEIKTFEIFDFETSDNYIKDLGGFRQRKGYLSGSIITQPVGAGGGYLCFQAYTASILSGGRGLSSCIFTWFLGLFYIHLTVSGEWNITISCLKNTHLVKPWWLIRKALERKKPQLLNKKVHVHLWFFLQVWSVSASQLPLASPASQVITHNMLLWEQHTAGEPPLNHQNLISRWQTCFRINQTPSYVLPLRLGYFETTGTYLLIKF